MGAWSSSCISVAQPTGELVLWIQNRHLRTRKREQRTMGRSKDTVQGGKLRSPVESYTPQASSRVCSGEDCIPARESNYRVATGGFHQCQLYTMKEKNIL